MKIAVLLYNHVKHDRSDDKNEKESPITSRPIDTDMAQRYNL